MSQKTKMTRYTLKDFQAQFPNDATCLEWLFLRFYPNGTVFCEKCQRETKHHRVASRPSYSCDYCGHHVHPTANTIFHKSPTPLTTWFYAIYLMASTRCGVSAKQIERETGVTYKTAWRMFKQIRSMLEDDKNPLGGPDKGVEADETYMGGKRKNGRGRPMRGDKVKTPVLGIVERRGRVVARVIDDTTAKTLCGNVRKYVLPSSTVFTDELNAYNTVSEGRRYTHHRINHSSKVYVMGNIHTNTIEGFWSLLKNGIRGVYHSISKGHLQSYLNEYSFRYNRRHDVQPMFVSFLKQIEKHDAASRRSPVGVCAVFA
ncbi:MAG: IS1595 family transposase [Acidobacteria bacterium]|nr:MAG: IS1595 family transposase [Acidobacteriota bacterium]